MLRYYTAGESHGQALLVWISGFPAGMPVDFDLIHSELHRRQLGYGRGGRQKIEKDRAEALAGIRHGKTIGAPIALRIENKDWANWEKYASRRGAGGRSAAAFPDRAAAGTRRPRGLSQTQFTRCAIRAGAGLGAGNGRASCGRSPGETPAAQFSMRNPESCRRRRKSAARKARDVAANSNGLRESRIAAALRGRRNGSRMKEEVDRRSARRGFGRRHF